MKLFNINMLKIFKIRGIEMSKLKFVIFFYLAFLISCSSTNEALKTDVIMFNKENYPPTIYNQLVIYKSRLDIPQKCDDIGVIKYQGEPNIDEIKYLSASKGADAILQNGSEFILIKFQKKL